MQKKRQERCLLLPGCVSQFAWERVGRGHRMPDAPLRLDPAGVGGQPAPAWRKSQINTHSFCDKLSHAWWWLAATEVCSSLEARCSKQVVDVARPQLENLLQPLCFLRVFSIPLFWMHCPRSRLCLSSCYLYSLRSVLNLTHTLLVRRCARAVRAPLG